MLMLKCGTKGGGMKVLSRIGCALTFSLLALVPFGETASASAPLTSPSHVHVSVGVGQATVSWGPSFPASKVAYYVVVALELPVGSGVRSMKTKQLHVTFTGLVKGARYSFGVSASGVDPLKAYSKPAEAGTFTIEGGNSSSGSTNLAACAIVLGNWVIATSNFVQANPNSIPPLMTQFGTSSPIEQWAISQVGTFLGTMVLHGQSTADSQLFGVATTECGVLQSSGVNIAAIPAAQ
jgi:hypothetical protein